MFKRGINAVNALFKHMLAASNTKVQWIQARVHNREESVELAYTASKMIAKVLWLLVAIYEVLQIGVNLCARNVLYLSVNK